MLQVLPKEAAEAWHCLRAAVLHYCRPPSAARPFTAAARQNAHNNMLRYAQLLEQHGFPGYMKTWNLLQCQAPAGAGGAQGCDWCRCRMVGGADCAAAEGADWWTCHSRL